MNNKKRINHIFYNKKALNYELFFNVFELVLAFIVILALLNFVNDVAEQTIFERNYMARDLALLINTFYAAPGELTYTYSENLQDFAFDFADNKLKVQKTKGKEEAEVFYFFASNNNLPFGSRVLSYEKENVDMKFTKSHESLDVRK